jgi:threonine dehydrogenase-like Zn-dependent dehydrogenase
MMLAGRLDLATRRFAVERVPVPEPRDDEVRIAVGAAGVCLSDVHLIDGTLKTSADDLRTVTLGHEVAGTVEARGSRVPDSVPIGQRALLQAGQSCGQCPNCLWRRPPCLRGRTRGVNYDGGWAEYALARYDTLVPIPDDLPFEQAAIIPDAVSTPYAAIVTTAGVRPAQSAGVWGIGGLGAHGLQLLRIVGAAPVIAVDPLPAARERAREFGADAALDPMAADFSKQVLRVTGGLGLDFAFDFAGVPAVRDQASDVLAPGGALVLVGLAPEPITLTSSVAFSRRKRRLLGHYGSSALQVEELVTLVRHHRLDLRRSVSGRIPLRDAAEAVRILSEGKNGQVRLVLRP